MMVELFKASERNGPVTHYLIIAVPEELARVKNTKDFKMDEVACLPPQIERVALTYDG